MPAVTYTPRPDGKREFQAKPTASDRPDLNQMLLLNEMEALREEVRKHYEVAGCVPGPVPGGTTLHLFVSGWDMSLPDIEGATTARALVPSSTEFSLGIWRNDVQVGTLTFPLGKGFGVFTWNSPKVTFRVGDVFRVISQDQEDATLADVAWRILFYRN